MPLVQPSIPLLQWLGTLLLAFLGAQTCIWLNTPIPWMLGPLIVTACASMAGAPTYSWSFMRKSGQATIGLSLGLYFTPDMVALIGPCGGPSVWPLCGRWPWAICAACGCTA